MVTRGYDECLAAADEWIYLNFTTVKCNIFATCRLSIEQHNSGLTLVNPKLPDNLPNTWLSQAADLLFSKAAGSQGRIKQDSESLIFIFAHRGFRRNLSGCIRQA